MIKLINILNELSINNPVVTPQKVYDYYVSDIYNHIHYYNPILNAYTALCRPYCDKYNISVLLNDIREFEKLSKQDLIKFYNEMQQLVRKHAK